MIGFLLGLGVGLFLFKHWMRKYLLTIAACTIYFNYKLILWTLYAFWCMHFGKDCM